MVGGMGDSRVVGIMPVVAPVANLTPQMDEQLISFSPLLFLFLFLLPLVFRFLLLLLFPSFIFAFSFRYRSLGFWSWVLYDYYSLNLMNWLFTPTFQEVFFLFFSFSFFSFFSFFSSLSFLTYFFLFQINYKMIFSSSSLLPFPLFLSSSSPLLLSDASHHRSFDLSSRNEKHQKISNWWDK